jgi:DNA-binding PadR family transcriptional regulator
MFVGMFVAIIGIERGQEPFPACVEPPRRALRFLPRCIVPIHRHAPAEGGGVLEFAILGLLHQSPMHGYELRKQLAQVLGGLRSISYGSLYPALKRMRAAGLISTDEPDPHALLPADAPPLTGRRGKVVYTITAEGKERFHELVGQTGPEAYDDGGSFGVRLAFFRHTASDVRLRILEGRRRTVERQREGLRASLARTRERLDHYTLELQRHGLESVDREVRWLSELIDTERREGGTPTPPDAAGSPSPQSTT